MISHLPAETCSPAVWMGNTIQRLLGESLTTVSLRPLTLTEGEGDINLSLIPSSVKGSLLSQPKGEDGPGQRHWVRGGHGGGWEERAYPPQRFFLLGPPPQPCGRHPRTADQMAAALPNKDYLIRGTIERKGGWLCPDGRHARRRTARQAAWDQSESIRTYNPHPHTHTHTHTHTLNTHSLTPPWQ